MKGERSGLLDLFWLAEHGQPLPREAWPAVLWVREWLGLPYSTWLALKEIADTWREK